MGAGGGGENDKGAFIFSSFKEYGSVKYSYINVKQVYSHTHLIDHTLKKISFIKTESLVNIKLID